MIISIESFLRRSRRLLRQWLIDPRFHGFLHGAAYALGGFLLSAASLGNRALPLSMGLVCATNGWSAVLAAVGSLLGYWVFWGSSGYQAMVWVGVALLCALLMGRALTESMPLLLPAAAGLAVAATGVLFQFRLSDTTPVLLYLLRVGLAIGSTWLLTRVLRGREPFLDWLACGMGVLALAQIMPIPYLGLGYLASGIVTVMGAFPAAALAGLGLDLAQITPVPMTAVVCLAYLPRLIPRFPAYLCRLAPGMVYLFVMALSGSWDIAPLPGLLLGGIIGGFLPAPGGATHRRGETGMVQVRLELAAGVMAQAEQLLLEVSPTPVDEEALVTRAAQQACGGCPCRKGCKDASRIAQLPAPILQKPLLSPEELPIVCRKSGRFLAELHRGQERLRTIRADRERQSEYRAAMIQQYGFLARYLRELSDRLARRGESSHPLYAPEVQFFGNRPQEDNGDRCARFPGVGTNYYVLLCDGMGTGLGAVHEGKTAATILRRLLTAGYPAEYALRSLNSLCALRDRAGAVTVDLLELRLDTGKASLYKWGAAPSYLVSLTGAEQLGTAGPPPGISVTDYRESVDHVTLRRGERLIMVSDGVDREHALRCCISNREAAPEELAEKLLSASQLLGQDDATVITVCLSAEGK